MFFSYKPIKMAHSFLKICLLFVSLLSGTAALCQKIEIEKKISREDFPKGALLLVEHRFPGAQKIKFYQERSADNTSFEAKFCFEKHRYSVEFTSSGDLLDIEKRLKFKELPLSTQEAIQQKWNQDFKRFSVQKCQQQTSDHGTRYEIEVKGKTTKGTAFYEYLFEANGRYIQKEKIILGPNDMSLY